MAKDKKPNRFMGMIKGGLNYTARQILAHISPPITKGVERVTRKIFSSVVIGLGAIFLVLALFFFLRESLGWSNSASYFSIGIIMLVIGLLLNAEK